MRGTTLRLLLYFLVFLVLSLFGWRFFFPLNLLPTPRQSTIESTRQSTIESTLNVFVSKFHHLYPRATLDCLLPPGITKFPLAIASGFYPNEVLPWGMCIKQHRQYALRHGYAFCQCSGIMDPPRVRIEYSKVTLVSELLQIFPWVAWFDQDVGIIHCERPLEQVFQISIHPNLDTYWVQDLNPDVINSGLFLIRQTAWSTQFLFEWDRIFARLVEPDHDWTDQRALMLYREFFPDAFRNYSNIGDHGKILTRTTTWATDWNSHEKKVLFMIHFLGFTPRALKNERAFVWFNETDRTC